MNVCVRQRPATVGCLVMVSVALLGGTSSVAAAQAGAYGTIQRYVRLTGEEPGNVVIRMSVDPMCARLTEGKMVIQEAVMVNKNGDLANVFVSLQGTFSSTPVPEEAIVIDQMDCIYRPRVVGARAGQELQVKNSDDLLHNVHAYSTTTNGFNIGQPMAGMVHTVKLADEDGGMFRLGCDLHRWMTAYVGVVPHSYFAVSDAMGSFTIDRVPAGRHTVRAWHEEYGVVTQTVTVKAGATATVDFSYAAESGGGRRRRR